MSRQSKYSAEKAAELVLDNGWNVESSGNNIFTVFWIHISVDFEFFSVQVSVNKSVQLVYSLELYVWWKPNIMQAYACFKM